MHTRRHNQPYKTWGSSCKLEPAKEQWQPIVRYDTAHGFAHKDVLKADGKTIKHPLFFETYNLAFTFATMDLKVKWEKYREDFERGD